jgi:hypothetical protein
MKIKQITVNGVRHVVIKDPTYSGCIALPIEDGPSPYAHPGNKWTWDGNEDAPTLSPSLLCNQDHFYVRAGKIEFLGDAKHARAGQTIDMPDMGDLADFWTDKPKPGAGT